MKSINNQKLDVDGIDMASRLRVPPYEKVIKKLQEIQNVDNPLKKAKVIKEARDLIPECVDEFW